MYTSLDDQADTLTYIDGAEIYRIDANAGRFDAVYYALYKAGIAREDLGRFIDWHVARRRFYG
jgi:hypothetical protein